MIFPISAKFQNVMHRLVNHSLSAPFVLLAISVLSYGLFLDWMGFHWDDWPIAWLSHISDGESIKYFQFQRPLSGAVIYLGMKLFGPVPIYWQITTFALRFCSALAMWCLIKAIWPIQKTMAFVAATLFLLFPGFSHQYVSVNSAPHLLALALFLSSLTLMVMAEREPKWRWLLRVAALLTSLLALLMTDYFYGLELIRPFVLWISTGEGRKTFRHIFRSWLPYLILLMAVFAWHTAISQFGSNELGLISDFRAAPIETLRTFGKTVFADLVTATWGAWKLPFSIPTLNDYGARAYSYYWLLVVLAGLGTFTYLRFTNQQSRTRGVHAIVLGIASLFAGGSAFWLTQFPFKLAFPSDRLALPIMLGSTLLIFGLIEIAVSAKLIKTILFSTLIGLAVGGQFLNAIAYRIDWDQQIYFFSQLFWRAPGLKPSTTLVSEELPLERESDNSLVAPINWIYAPYFGPPASYYDWEYRIDPFIDMPFYYSYLDLRLGWQLPPLEQAADFSTTYRFFHFNGNSSDVILLYYQPPYCLRVLDPIYDQGHPHLLGDEYYKENPGLLDPVFSKEFPTLPNLTAQALPFSDTSLIQANATHAIWPEEVFGPQAAADWCFYFERADLARQNGDWDQVASLGDQALAEFEPRHASELPVFIEGYAKMGRLEDAKELTDLTLRMDASMQTMLCLTWDRIEGYTGGIQVNSLNCP